ncbi:MAG TPA: PLP-dependent transferase, partial [Planctomycetaceae bacterium]|nr:PLP-dependent transferase [Planctomycetaceae bacterium]
VFCEIPSNPLLRSPNIGGLRELTSRYQVPLLIDDTLGGTTNLRMLPAADVLVTSLTKYFSGVGDVMGGAWILNADSPLYTELKELAAAEFEDMLFDGDAVTLEVNSRDCAQRMQRINNNAETLAGFLHEHRAVMRVYYPKYETTEHYNAFRREGAGYGGLLSFDVTAPAVNAPRVFDALRVAKGPNLGTNYTLSCPYTILAHYQELDFAERCGVSRYLIRVSVGLEPTHEIIARFAEALEYAGS